MSPRPAPPSFDSAIRTGCTGYPVILAYVFGSHARGTADSESDIDIAILAQPHLSKIERHELRLRLKRSLADALSSPTDLLDVIILQDVPVLLRLNVIRSGRLVLERQPGTRAEFECDTERAYEDEQPMLERETELTLARLTSRPS